MNDPLQVRPMSDQKSHSTGRLVRVLCLIACVLVVAGCQIDELQFKNDRRLSFTTPEARSKVDLPVTISWTMQDFEATGLDGSQHEDEGVFAVFVDQAPMPVGKDLKWLARHDPACERKPDCPDAEYLAERSIYVTTDPTVTLDHLPTAERGRGDEQHYAQRGPPRRDRSPYEGKCVVPAVPYREALVVTAVDATVDPRSDRRDAARRTLGVSGESAVDEPAPLRPILRQHQLTVYPMVALGLLGIVDSFQGYAFSVLTPEISRTLGLSLGAIAGARTLAFLAAILAPLPVAAISQRPGRRALLCVATGIAWSIITVMTGFVMSLLALIVVLVLDGLSTGSVSALHAPLLVDSYPPKARVRVLSGYQGLVTAGQVISPLFVAVLAGPLDLTWRGVFLAMGVTSLLTTLVALGLRDPGPGRFDTDVLRADEHADDAHVRLEPRLLRDHAPTAPDPDGQTDRRRLLRHRDPADPVRHVPVGVPRAALGARARRAGTLLRRHLCRQHRRPRDLRGPSGTGIPRESGEGARLLRYRARRVPSY